MRRAAFSTPCGVASSPRAAAANSSASGMVSQSAYESRLAVTYGFHFGSAVSSRRNRKFGRLQHRLDHQLRALEKSVSRAQQRFVALLLRRLERPAEGLQSELANEPRAAGGRRLARNQPVRIAAAERVARQLSRRRRCRPRSAAAKGSAPAIWFRKPLTKSSGGNWFAGEVWSPSRSRTVWLYWLWVSRRRSGCGSALARRRRLPLRDISAPAPVPTPESLRQLCDPRLEDRFVRLPGLIRSPPACGDAVGRLVQQQRCVRVLAIDQRHQRSSEGLDLARAASRVRESGGGWPTPRRPDYGRNGRRPSPSPDKGPLRMDASCAHKGHSGNDQSDRNV